MKVGVFVEDVSPQVGGGYTIQGDILQSLIKLAPQSRHEFAVFSRNPEDLSTILKDSPINCIRFPGTLSQRVVSAANRKINARRQQRARQSRFEQVAVENGIEFIWFVGAEAMQVDLPYIAIVWDLQHRLQPWFPEVSSGGVWEHRELFYSQFLRRATFIIAGTTAGSEEIQRFYQVPANRIKILPHPTPSFALQPNAREGTPEILKRLGLSPGYLFYPAQLWSHKNHATLLSALRILKSRFDIKVPLVLVGSDKGNREYLDRLVRELNLTDEVLFVGFVSQLDLVALYENALALTYVSHFGPENLPPLEAFALGCPVIASSVEGSEEQLGDAALLVDPTKPEELAAAIASVYRNTELRATLVERGKVRAARWTGSHFVMGIFSILDDFEAVRRCWA